MESSPVTHTYRLGFFSVLALGLPSIAILFAEVHLPPLVATCVYGAGIMAAAFLLSWAAEVAELDISASLAIAIVALLTVLPEYAIEAILAWDAGASFDAATGEITPETQRVSANVNGANRLLIGLGWAVVILIYWAKHRGILDLRGRIGPEVNFLAIATLLSFAIFVLRGIHVLLAALLIGVYLVYLWMSSRKEAEEPEMEGITRWLGSLPTRWRRAVVVGLFVYAAGIILVAAEPFVGSLIDTGRQLGVDDFILIQWLAPVASETPEVVVAVLFALRANPSAALEVLISSGVIKTTLLVGSMVVIFSLSAGQVLTFPLDDRQAIEFLLTTAVAVFGLLLIARRVLDWRAGAALLVLFIAHLFFPKAEHRLWMTGVYFALAVLLIARDWRRVKFLFREYPQEPADTQERC